MAARRDGIRARALIADDVRNTGQTFERGADLVNLAGGTLVGAAQMVDRCEAEVTLPVPNIALMEYTVPPNDPSTTFPPCAAATAITRF
jgi:adenine/guanine phosphoribosyltransferase-like PRPP-binding protein